MYFYYGKIKSNISSSIPASNLVNTSLQRREVLPGYQSRGSTLVVMTMTRGTHRLNPLNRDVHRVPVKEPKEVPEADATIPPSRKVINKDMRVSVVGVKPNTSGFGPDARIELMSEASLSAPCRSLENLNLSLPRPLRRRIVRSPIHETGIPCSNLGGTPRRFRRPSSPPLVVAG